MKKFVYIIFACLTIQSANAIENEDYYNRQFCTQVSGQPSHPLYQAKNASLTRYTF
jgi:hypothetical protein